MSEANTPARPVLPTEQKDYVTLRELEQRLTVLREMVDERTRYEREILSTRENSLKDALEKAALETERRLTELNHAHANAKENWRQSLPREVFEAHLTELRGWRDRVNTFITAGAAHEGTLTNIVKQLDGVDKSIQQAQGALVLIRFMGLAGVLALIVTFLRMAGAIP